MVKVAVVAPEIEPPLVKIVVPFLHWLYQLLLLLHSNLMFPNKRIDLLLVESQWQLFGLPKAEIFGNCRARSSSTNYDSKVCCIGCCNIC
jgi:hypothetical protein